MEVMTLTPPDTKDLIAKSDDLTRQALQIKIKDNESYERAGSLALEIKNWIKIVEEKFKESCDAAFKAHRAITAFRNETLQPYQDAESLVNRSMSEFRRQVEAKRQAESIRLAEEARREAEKKRLKEIEAAKAVGDKEGAKNLKAAPVVVPSVAPKTPEAPKIKGVTVRKVWDYQITDPNMIPRKYLTIDTTAIRRVVQALGMQHGIPGVAAYQKDIQ